MIKIRGVKSHGSTGTPTQQAGRTNINISKKQMRVNNVVATAAVQRHNLARTIHDVPTPFDAIGQTMHRDAGGFEVFLQCVNRIQARDFAMMPALLQARQQIDEHSLRAARAQCFNDVQNPHRYYRRCQPTAIPPFT